MLNLYDRKPLREVDKIPFFIEPDLYTENYEEISRVHLSHGEENPFIGQLQWEEMEKSTIDLIKLYYETDDYILDLGVGTGKLLSQLEGNNKYGVDVSENYLRLSAKKKINVCKANIEALPYKSNQFDMVISTDVFEHVFDLNRVLNEVIRVLKPGGFLIFRVPYKENLEVYLTEDYPFEFVHIRNFDEFSIRLMMEKVFRFKTLSIQKTGFISGKRKSLIMQIPIIRSIYYRLTHWFWHTFFKSHPKYFKWINHPSEINWVGQMKSSI